MRPGLFAFAAASAFLGAALYINLVEQPARLALDARSMVREWAPSNRRGFVMLASLAAISATLAYVDFAHTGDVRWIIGGTVILASWPYAYFVMVPLNIWLCTIPRGNLLGAFPKRRALITPISRSCSSRSRDWLKNPNARIDPRRS